MATPREMSGEDVTAVLAWALRQVNGASSHPMSMGAKLETWFARAAQRWPAAWFESRRSSTALLWIASRAAALESFDSDGSELYEERAAIRATGAPWHRSIAELLAVGDVLLSMGLIAATTASALPPALRKLSELHACNDA